MKKLSLLLCLTAPLLLAGCDDDAKAPNSNQVQQTASQAPAPQAVQGQPVAEQPQVVYVQPEQQQQNPQVVYQQAPQQPVVVQQHDSTGSLLTGMMVGHMLSNSGGGGYSNGGNRTVVNKTIINKTYVRPSVKQPSRSYYGSRSVSNSRSSFGSSRKSFRRR